MGEMVSYDSGGVTSEGYLALPASGSGPAVIVIQEWWGLVPHLVEVADRFARAGFVALAPDLYHGRHTTEPDEAAKLMAGLAMDQAARDLTGAAAYLAGHGRVTGRVGAAGFGLGGSLATWSATLSEHVVAAASFYPVLPWERMSPDWDRYAGKASVVHCSEQDGTSAAAGIQFARRMIEGAGGTCTVYDYPGTSHAYFNDDRPEVYHGVASASAWARTLGLFRTWL
jgi:carboxymethylenebutenolidase